MAFRHGLLLPLPGQLERGAEAGGCPANGSRARSLLRSVAGLSLALLSAVLLNLAFPPHGAWPLVWVGLVPAVVAQHRVLPRALSGVGAGLAIGGFFWGYFRGMFAHSFMQWLPLMIGIVAMLVSSRDRAFHERTGYRWFVLQGAGSVGRHRDDPRPGTHSGNLGFSALCPVRPDLAATTCDRLQHIRTQRPHFGDQLRPGPRSHRPPGPAPACRNGPHPARPWLDGRSGCGAPRGRD